MFFKKSKEIEKLKKRNKELIYSYNVFIKNQELEIEKLEKENKKLIEDFVKNYHYVLMIDKNRLHTYLYQDGQEIKNIKNIDFEASIDSVPTFNVEVN